MFLSLFSALGGLAGSSHISRAAPSGPLPAAPDLGLAGIPATVNKWVTSLYPGLAFRHSQDTVQGLRLLLGAGPTSSFQAQDGMAPPPACGVDVAIDCG